MQELCDIYWSPFTGAWDRHVNLQEDVRESERRNRTEAKCWQSAVRRK